jgi:uncharacterized protein YebE (UPF0316 family)
VTSLGSLLPVVIFLAEMFVVTLGTLRIIFVARGCTLLAPVLGLFEILSWLFAISQVMQNLDSADCFIAFSLGFTCGSYLGMWIEKKLAMGTVLVRVITHHSPAALIADLRAAHFGVTCVEGRGATGPVQILMTVVKRRQLEEVKNLIRGHHPRAFVAVDELQDVAEGTFPRQREGMLPGLPAALRILRGLRPRRASQEHAVR